MTGERKLVVFCLDDHLYALYLEAVRRVVPAVEITLLPGAPEVVAGVINVGGDIIPVFDLRKRFRMPGRELRLEDQLIVARTARYTVALMVDRVADVITAPLEEVTGSETVLPGLEYVDGVVKLEDGMVLIHDINRFLSLDEEKIMVLAIQEQNDKGASDLNGIPEERK